MKLSDLRIVFFGTPDFAVHVLDELAEAGITPALIVTAPDRAQGRGMQLSSPPVKDWADEHGIDVIQPEKIDGAFLAELGNTEWDLFLVAAYGLFLPPALLSMPEHQTLNVHPSLLPKLRGASPVQTAVLTDQREAVGVSIMLVDEKMDHGPIVSQARIEPEEWPMDAALLEELLAHAGGGLLAETIPEWVGGKIEPEAQDDDQASASKKIEKKDGELDLSADAWQNYLKIKALAARPGTYFFTQLDGRGMRVKVLDAEFENGVLEITRVIPEGKNETSYEDFLRSTQSDDV